MGLLTPPYNLITPHDAKGNLDATKAAGCLSGLCVDDDALYVGSTFGPPMSDPRANAAPLERYTSPHPLVLCSSPPALKVALTLALPGPVPCTLHPVPCTLHPAPCTLHPVPCTMHHAPCTMHAAPCTLHPASCTPHPSPAPCTPHPSHSDLGGRCTSPTCLEAVAPTLASFCQQANAEDVGATSGTTERFRTGLNLT